MVLAIPDVAKTQAEGTNAIAYIFNAHFPTWVTDVFLVAVSVAIFVCCLAIQAATTRLLFAYGRDKMVPASRFFGYVHPSTRTPMISALFVAVTAVVVLLYVNLGGSDPFIAIARVTAWATAGTYIAYQMVVFGGSSRAQGLAQGQGLLQPQGWGWPVNIIAFVYGVFMIVNLAWPRTPDAAWYDNYLVIVSLGVVLLRRRRLPHPAGTRRRPQRDHPGDRRVAGRGAGLEAMAAGEPARCWVRRWSRARRGE